MATAPDAPLRYQGAILIRSYRWVFPLIAYCLLIAVGAAGSTSPAETLDWSAAMLRHPGAAMLTTLAAVIIARSFSGYERATSRAARTIASVSMPW